MQLESCEALLFQQSLEDCKLEHVREQHLRLNGLKPELHLYLLLFEAPQEPHLRPWLVDYRVEAVHEAQHVAFVADGEVKCFAVLQDERNAAPGVPDVLFLIRISP